jgi:ubiquinone/menaquinone biosynthesis C-methylase UbiE
MQKGGLAVPKDKSLFYYGPVYHKLFDPPLAEGGQVALELLPEGASVLDVGCGTGVFSSRLRKEKNCRVVGIDLSLKMLEFARRSSPYPEVTFRHEDATDLSAFQDLSFDYSTILNVMHELSRAQQGAVLMEALRVARKAVLIDWASSLPRNVGGIGARVVEATFGHDHNLNFKAFLAAGGIAGVLRESALPVTVDYRCVFSHNCREAVVVRAAQPV